MKKLSRLKQLTYQHNISIVDKQPLKDGRACLLLEKDIFLLLVDHDIKFFLNYGIYYHFKTGKCFLLFKDLFTEVL